MLQLFKQLICAGYFNPRYCQVNEDLILLFYYIYFYIYTCVCIYYISIILTLLIVYHPIRLCVGQMNDFL